jgi:hypothetical protein
VYNKSLNKTKAKLNPCGHFVFFNVGCNLICEFLKILRTILHFLFVFVNFFKNMISDSKYDDMSDTERDFTDVHEEDFLNSTPINIIEVADVAAGDLLPSKSRLSTL